MKGEHGQYLRSAAGTAHEGELTVDEARSLASFSTPPFEVLREFEDFGVRWSGFEAIIGNIIEYLGVGKIGGRLGDRRLIWQGKSSPD
jgi:hypothetical protein